MRRCLIVANQTLDSPTLAKAVQQRISTEEHTFFVVVLPRKRRNRVLAT